MLAELMAGLPSRLYGRPLPSVIAVTVSAKQIGLLLSKARTEPADGFTVIDDGLSWIIDAADIATVNGSPKGQRDLSVPWPLMVSIGRVASGGSKVMVNLEELAAVELIGERSNIVAFSESLAGELASNWHLGCPRVVCVGCAWELDALADVRIVRSLGGVLSEAKQQRKRLDLVTAKQGPLPEQRRHGLSGLPRPLVIIDPHGHDPRTLAHLRRLAGPGLALVAAWPGRLLGPRSGSQPAEAGWKLWVSARRLRWEPVGVDLQLEDPPRLPASRQLQRQRLSRLVLLEETAEMTDSLTVHDPKGGSTAGLAVESQINGRPTSLLDAPLLDHPLLDAPTVLAPCPGIVGFGWADEAPDAQLPQAVEGASPGPVELQVLGVVQAVGAAAPFTSQRALDLVCYLALHRDGATADTLRYWLWRRSESPPTSKAFANVVSRARLCLGYDTEGDPYLPYVGTEGVYRISPEVTTDLERFAAWLSLAERVPPQQALECLRAALWLVRGAPFSGGTGGTFSWVDASWRGHVEFLVDSTAHRLADLALELDRVEVARWAALRGLVFTPNCDQCYQRRIAVARRSGHQRELELVLAELERLQSEPQLDDLPIDMFDATLD